MQNETGNPVGILPTAGTSILYQTTRRYTTVYIPTEFDLSPKLSNAIVPCIIVSLFIGLIANILAVFITYSCAKENNEHRPTIPAILTRALLATDLSATVFFLLRGMFFSVYNNTLIQCDLDLASNLIFSWVSGLINMLMSCDRCLALGTPFFYHTHATRRITYIALAISVLIATLISCLPVMGFGAYKVYIHEEYHCLAPGDLQAKATVYDFHFNVLFFILGLGVIVIIYASNAVVLFHLLKLNKRLVVVTDYDRTKPVNSNCEDGDVALNMSVDAFRSASRNDPVQLSSHLAYAEVSNMQHELAKVDNVSTIDLNDGRDNSRPVVRHRVKSSTQRPTNSGKTEMRFGLMILVFSLVFSLSWLPFYIQRLMKAFSSSTSNVVLVIVIYLLIFNHVIDPFVYVLMKRQYRQKLLKLSRRWRFLLCRCCGRGNE
ncbi:uncharacterized protein, partial [Asterias amurensis]|uniref:uncharacterized protein n=1 Tax=Asterias amurensis TaxID=7602 RepID=UPI003AB26930